MSSNGKERHYSYTQIKAMIYLHHVAKWRWQEVAEAFPSRGGDDTIVYRICVPALGEDDRYTEDRQTAFLALGITPPEPKKPKEPSTCETCGQVVP